MSEKANLLILGPFLENGGIHFLTNDFYYWKVHAEFC